VRGLLTRSFVLGVLLVGLTGTSLLATATEVGATFCEQPRHDCAKAVFTDCCCPSPSAATTALSVFVDAWSSVAKLYRASTCWNADGMNVTEAVETAFALALRAERASSARPPLTPADSATILLI